MEKVVFDAFAILSLLEKEKGYEMVSEYLENSSKGKGEAHMSVINWGEVYYILVKRGKTVAAEELWEGRGEYPIVFVEPTVRRIRLASRIKGVYPVSYADAFCIALAMELDAKVITGDEEFKNVDGLDVLLI
jgi:predicted nucleic acid-binding protein